MDKDDTYVRVYNLKDAIAHGKNKTTTDLPFIQSFKSPTDHIINMAKWGPLD